MEAISGQLLFDFEASEIPTVRTMTTKTESKPSTDEEAEEWFQRGLALEETGAPVDQALNAYRKAIELNPNAAGALVNLGTIALSCPQAARGRRLLRAGDPSRPALSARSFQSRQRVR